MTDNKNRTASDVRHAFSASGGTMGTTGCVSWMFDKKGVLVIEDEDGEIDEDELTMAAIDAGAEDFTADDGVFEITTAPADFSAVRDELEKAGYVFATAEIEMVPQNMVEADESLQAKIEKMLDILEDNDDVQNVWHNADIDE